VTNGAGQTSSLSTPGEVPPRQKSDVHWPVRLYAVITLMYIALMTWWVTFFARQGTALAELARDAGVPFGPAQLEVLSISSQETSRMLLYEGSFVGVLLVTSVWLVARAQRHERALARRQRNFLSAVTHEFRSPIASARLCLDSILLGRTDEQKTERYLRMARVDLDRLSTMAEDVLATRALVEGRGPMRFETVNMSDLAHRAIAARSESPLASEVPLRVEAPESVRIHADPKAVGRLLENLVSNALKYCGGKGEVVVSVSRSGGMGLLAVSDAGPGLQGVHPKKLTGAFVRGGDEQLRTQPGVGLGLHIVEQLVAAHEGKLTFIDQGAGLTVKVELPLATDTDEDPS